MILRFSTVYGVILPKRTELIFLSDKHINVKTSDWLFESTKPVYNISSRSASAALSPKVSGKL